MAPHALAAVSPDVGEVLELWERAVAAAPAERADALLAASDEVVPSSLGARNAALLALRARLFGATQPLRCDCATCGTTAEFTIDCAAVARRLLPGSPEREPHRLEADGLRIEFRVPCVDDVRAASGRGEDRTAFAAALLRRCVTRCEREDGGLTDPAELPLAVAEALSRHMEALDPGANVSFDLTCPACGASWSAHMDCADVLWSELQVRAESLLLAVDALARAYGWSEAQVLALSPTRRAAYLQMAGA